MNKPSLGFYRHYKHNPSKDLTNYTYKVIGVGVDTETRVYSVIYLPLYKNNFLAPADYCVRPLEMFNEEVEVEGKRIKRFIQITDRKLISRLEKIVTK